MKKNVLLIIACFIATNSFSQSYRNIERIKTHINTFNRDCLFSEFDISINGNGIFYDTTISFCGEKDNYTTERITFPIAGVDFCINPDKGTLSLKINKSYSQDNISIIGFGNCKCIEIYCSDNKTICDLLSHLIDLKHEFNSDNYCNECK